ncbi:MAG: hypothetical protein V2I33_04430, partial [Kangiellaceae bacterium]|nr:hypothetical protein [Kangiellaceae bacterium]
MQISNTRFMLLLTAICIFASSAHPANKNIVPRFEPVTDNSFPINVPKRFRSTVGYLVVTENHQNTNGSTIKLPIAIIHAVNQSKNNRPILYLGGGPGNSSLNVAKYPGAYPFIEDHDFIIMEQRGTKYAKPRLDCPEYNQAIIEANLKQQDK